MNRELELEHLFSSEARIAGAKRMISEQQARIAKLRGDGYDTKLAEDTLRAFEASLAIIREHRETIIKAIENIDHGL